MLHQRRAEEDVLAPSYGSRYLLREIPKYRLQEEELPPEIAYRVVSDELILDGNSRQNLATFCTTWVPDEIQRLMRECIDKNMIDKDEYPQAAEIESRCVNILADLWHSPRERDAVGCSTTGSSEAAMLAGLAMKWRWRAKTGSRDQSGDRPNLVTGPVQVCWHKFARYWDVELREIPLESGRLTMSGEEVARRCDQNTIGVVATLGTTFTGHYEPVKEVVDALDDLQKNVGLDIPVHVDAASGGFVAPFLDPGIPWDFRLPRVKSINASGHKFGLSPLGVGWIVWRSREDLPEDLVFYVNYLGGQMPTFALNFSRPAGEVIAQYYNFLRLGRDGYRRIQQMCRSVAVRIAQEVASLGPFKVIHGGDSGIPVVTWTLKSDGSPGFDLFDLSAKLRSYGWQVPAYTMPANLDDLAVMRVVVRHGVSMDMAEHFLQNLRDSLNYFERHPVSSSMTAEEGAGFNHSGSPKAIRTRVSDAPGSARV
jgi:glutamate decarboxylase